LRSHGVKPSTLAGEHLEHRRLSRAIGPQKADEFSFLDLEADPVRGPRLVILARAQPLDRAPQPRLLAIGAVDFRKLLGDDHADREIARCRVRTQMDVSKPEGSRKRNWDIILEQLHIDSEQFEDLFP
jgi:hypothetical protein